MKTVFEKIFWSSLFAVAGILVFSCSDDDSADPYDTNYTYVYAPGNTAHQLLYYADGNFVSDITVEEKLVPVRCTRPAPSNVEVTFRVDESLVEAYNKEHATEYVLLKKVELINSKLVIRKGEFESKDTLKVKYTDLTEFQDGSKHYILPVVISQITGGTTLSEKRIIYLTYESNVILFEEKPSPTGHLIEDRSGWTVTMMGKDIDGDGQSMKNVIDGNNNTYVYSEDNPTELVFNLGKKEQISDISFTFYAWYYAPQQITIALSDDGSTYEDLGSTTLGQNSSSILTLYKKRSSQYIKIDLSGYWYYTAHAIKEINMYRAE